MLELNKQKRPSTILLALLVSFPAFAAVLISPALPKIAEVYKLSAGKTQQLITIFVIGYAIAQLASSPFANRFGRKFAGYLGVSVFACASLLAIIGVWMQNHELIFIGRFFSALGSSVGLALTYTIINDCYAPQERRSVTGYVTLAFAVMPSLSVAIGGALTSYLSWKWCFYFLFFYSFVVYGVLFFLPETYQKKGQDTLKILDLLKRYQAAFSSLRLLLFSLLAGLALGNIYLFISESPFIGISQIGLSPSVFGLLMLLPYAGQVVGCLVAAKLSHKKTPIGFISLGLFLIGLGAFSILFFFLIGWISVWTLFAPLFFVMVGIPITNSNASMLALLDYPDPATGSAVMTFIFMMPTVIFLVSRSFIKIQGPLLMPSAFVLLIILNLVLFSFIKMRFLKTA